MCKYKEILIEFSSYLYAIHTPFTTKHNIVTINRNPPNINKNHIK